MADLRSKALVVIMTWAAAWPIITLLLMLVNDLVAGMPLPIKTLAISGIMVPIMALVISPIVQRAAQSLSRTPRIES